MSSSNNETSPLLPDHREPSPASPAPDSWSRAVLTATKSSVGLGIVMLVLLVISIFLVSDAPSGYSPPFDIYYYFTPTAAFSILVIIHSTMTLVGSSNGVPPPQGWTGILVDVFSGSYFLFQSLWGMQALLEGWYHRGCLPGCRDWITRINWFFWPYLTAMMMLGIVHTLLLFLRGSRFKRTQRVLLVQLIGSDGMPITVNRVV